MGSGGSRQKRKSGGNGNRKQLLKSLCGHTGGINCMDISLSGSYLLTGSDDRTARVWDLVTYENKVVLEGHSGYISCCKIWQDRFALTGSVDKTIRKWNMLSGNCVLKMELHRGIVNRLFAYGSYLFSSSYDRTAICWNVDSGQAARVFRGHKQSILPMLYIKTADHDPRGAEDVDRNKDAIITGSMDCTAKIWSIHSGTSLRTFRGHKGAILCLTLDRDKKYLYTGSTDFSIKKWNLANGSLLKSFKGHEGSVICLEINHKLLYSASIDCSARCWVAEFGDTTRKYSGHEHMISDMKYHNGLLITSSGDNTVRVFDAKSGSLKRTFKGHKYAVNCLLAVDSIIFSASYDGTIRLWNIRDLVRDKLNAMEGEESCSSLPSSAPSLIGEETIGSEISVRNGDGSREQKAMQMSTFKTEREEVTLSNRTGHPSRQKRRGGKSTTNKIAPMGNRNNNNNISEELCDILDDEEVASYPTRSSSSRTYHDAMEPVDEQPPSKTSLPLSRPASNTKRSTASALQLSRSSTKASLFSNAELTTNRITRSSSYANEGDMQLHSASTYSRTTGSMSISLPSSTNSSRPVTHTSKNGHTRESSDVSRKRAKTEDNSSRMSSADLALVDEEMRMIAVETDSTSTGYHSDKSSPQSLSLNENEKKTQLPLTGKRTIPKSRLKSKIPSPVAEGITPRRTGSKPSVWTPCTNSVDASTNKAVKSPSKGGGAKRTTKTSSVAVDAKATLTQNERERLENEILEIS